MNDKAKAIIAGEGQTHWYECCNCGHVIQPSQRECYHCGAKFDWEDEE